MYFLCMYNFYFFSPTPVFHIMIHLIKNHFKLILFVQKNHNFFYFPPPNRKCIHPYSTDTFPVFFSDATLLMRFFLCVYYFCRNTNALPHWISFFVSVAYLDMIHNEGGYVILLGNSWKSLLIAVTITKTEYEAEMQSKIRGQRQFVIHILMCHAKYTLKGLAASFSITNSS